MSEMVAAFIKMQQDLPKVGKDSEANTGKFSYTYASLPCVLDVVLPVLNRHDFGLTQRFENGEMRTELLHKSGDALVSTFEMPSPRTMSPQDFGKAETYYRRYALIAILGVAPDEDTDAVGVEAPAGEDQRTEYALAAIAARLMRDDADTLREWNPGATKAGMDEAVGKLLRSLVGPDLETLSDAERDNIYDVAKSQMNVAIDQRNA